MGLHIGRDKDAAITYYTAYFGQLVGAKITGFQMVKDEDDEYGDLWPCFAVTLKDGTKTTLELSQDEEGNGPGFLFGLDMPSTEGGQ